MKNFILGCLCIDEKKRFDWDQIFLHPLFGSKFEANFHNKSGSTKISFIMANLRMNIHSNNINLNKILSKLKDPLSKDDFIELMKFIYK
jgi:serine/threonine protein kinase